MMFRKEFSLLLVISALFSGQIIAEHKGHEFVYVKTPTISFVMKLTATSYAARLRSLRRVARAPYRQKSRKPDTHSAG